MSVDANTGKFECLELNQFESYEDLDVIVFEAGFNNSHMTISDDGIIYASDGLRFTAFRPTE